MSQSRNESLPLKEQQGRQPYDLTKEVITGVLTGGIIGVSILPIDMVTRKIQIENEKKAVVIEPVKVSAKTAKSALLYNVGKSTLSAIRGGIQKITILSQKDNVTEFVAEKKVIPSEDVSKDLNKESFKPSLKDSLTAAGVLAVIDGVLMNPSSNRKFWLVNAILDKKFQAPNPVTFEQKTHASTAAVTTRILRNSPTIAGLLTQEKVKDQLPEHLSDSPKSVASALIASTAITPANVVLDSLHSAQLKKVDPTTCTVPSLVSVVKAKGVKSAIPPSLIACHFVRQATLQYMIPKVTQTVETQLTPKITRAAHSFFESSLVKSSINSRKEEQRNPDPTRNNGL